MKLGNEVYTTSRVTWVNDLLNHKNFSTLMKKTYFANKVLSKTSVEANIVELQKRRIKNTNDKLEANIEEKKQNLEKVYQENLEILQDGIDDYEKQIFFEEDESEQMNDSDEEYQESNRDDNDDSDYSDGQVRRRNPRRNRRTPEYFGDYIEGGNDNYSATNFNNEIQGLGSELMKKILDKEQVFQENSIKFINDILRVDLNQYFKEGTTTLPTTKNTLDKIRNELSKSIKENFENLTTEIEELNNDILKDTEELKNKKKRMDGVQAFKETSYEKLEPPINVHNLYLHNKLKISIGTDIKSRNIKDFYDKILPMFIRTRDRKDNELTSGNKYFKDLLYGGIEREDIQKNEIPLIIQNYYDSMNSVYKKYIRDDTSIRIQNERNVLYTGVDEIYFKFSKPGVPTRRVFFTIELIEGEVNDDNKEAITCPYTGEYLGLLFEKIFYGSDMFGWKVKPAEFLYSVKMEKAERTKSDLKEEREERENTREAQMQVRQDTELPLIELKEFNDFFQPQEKKQDETLKFNQADFDDFFEKLISDDYIQSLLEDAAQYSIRHPTNKKLYIIKHEPRLELNVKTRLIKPTATDGLLQELSKYYNTDSRNINLKNNWEQHKQTLTTKYEQLIAQTDNQDMNDDDKETNETQKHIAKYLLAIMNQGEELVVPLFKNVV